MLTDFPSAAQLALLAEPGDAHRRSEHGVLTVMTDDRPGIFSRRSPACSRCTASTSSRPPAYSSDDGARSRSSGWSIRVRDEPPWDRVDATSSARSTAASRCRPASPSGRAPTRGATGRSAPPPTAGVRFDNDASQAATVIDVHAPDGIGVLYRITRALAELDVDIRSARVQTLGHQVVDAFYVRRPPRREDHRSRDRGRDRAGDPPPPERLTRPPGKSRLVRSGISA